MSGDQYSVKKNIRFKIPMLRSDFCDYSDAYLDVKGTTIVEGINDINKRNKNLSFKSNAPFRSCISKINNAYVGNAKDLDIAMAIYNLIERVKITL